MGTIDVEVVHGDLRFATHAVMVGHYAGSTLMGAELALDRAFDGRLTQRDLLGIYPGAVETCAIIPGGQDAHPGLAVVVGLGEIGMLTGARVSASVAQAAVQLAMAAIDEKASDREEADATSTLRLGISSVLLGTTGRKDLSIDHSVAAIVTAVASANQRLGDARLPRPVRFDRIQVVEMYEDLAIEAVHAVHRLVDWSPDSRVATQLITAARHLVTSEGGVTGQPPPDYEHGEWTPIIVETVSPVTDRRDGDAARTGTDEGSSGDDNRASRMLPATGGAAGVGTGSRHGTDNGREGRTADTDNRRDAAHPRGDLAFTSTGMAARAEQIVHARQRTLIERLVKEVVGRWDPHEQVFNTLYELLLPDYLKASATDADNLLLVLDRDATRYPWEMLAPRGCRDSHSRCVQGQG